MFAFNRYDDNGTEYVCIFRDGTHHVNEVIGEYAQEVFSGNYESCLAFVERKIDEVKNDL